MTALGDLSKHSSTALLAALEAPLIETIGGTLYTARDGRRFIRPTVNRLRRQGLVVIVRARPPRAALTRRGESLARALTTVADILARSRRPQP